MTDAAHGIARQAARKFIKRDKLQDALRRLDAEIRDDTTAYMQAMRTYGFTPLMLRQACEARGLLERGDG